MKIAVRILMLGSLLLGAGAAHAQIGSPNRAARGGGALFPLPQGVTRIVSLDAYNTLLVQTQDDDGKRGYTLIPIRHVYAGGIAALFGGVSIPTAQFVSPGQFGGGGGNGNGNGNGFGVSGFGGGLNNGGGGLGFNGSGINNGFVGAANGTTFNPDGSVTTSQTTIGGPNGTQIPLANGPFQGPTF